MTTLPPALADEVAHMQFLLDQGYYDPRPLGDGNCACIVKFAYTHAIILTRIGDRTGYEDRWCYCDYASAKLGLDLWDGTGEPSGWHRHPVTGRRREMVGNELVEKIYM